MCGWSGIRKLLFFTFLNGWIITNDKIIHHVMKCPIDTNVNYYFKFFLQRSIIGSCGQADGIKRQELPLFTRIEPLSNFINFILTGHKTTGSFYITVRKIGIYNTSL